MKGNPLFIAGRLTMQQGQRFVRKQEKTRFNTSTPTKTYVKVGNEFMLDSEVDSIQKLQ
jgi:hypothetical protein